MHVIQIRWLLLVFGLIEALNYTDLGLPNSNNCAFAYDDTLYIQGTNNVSITFGNPWDIDPPRVSKQHSYDPAIACAITRSGKLVLLSSNSPLQAFDMRWQSTQNITYQGSQNAIDRFTTRSQPISNVSLVAFRDYVMLQAETTFILDTRFPTQWTWYELLATSLAPPLTGNDLLVATSRWILHFRTSTLSNGYTTVINCFDPLSFIWLGDILTFNTTTLIQATQIQSTIEGSDSVLLSSVVNLSETTTNSEADTVFWKLDISTWIHTNISLSPIMLKNESISKSTATYLGKDLVVFYGDTIQFFNTTSFTFAPQPQWLYTPKPENSTTSKKNDLAIILGSVMGSLLFLAILVLFIYCCLKNKRSRHNVPRHIDNHKNKSLHWPLLNQKNPKLTARMYEPSDSSYVLSPIQSTSPIQLFPSEQSTSRMPPMKSRFIEHFDYDSFPLVKGGGTPLKNASSPLLKIEESTKNKLPRSVSSCV